MRVRKRAFSLPMLIIIGICLIFNAICWFSRSLTDAYVWNVFPVVSSVYSRFSSLFSFSIGEILLVVVSIYLFIAIIVLLLRIIMKIASRAKKTELSNNILDAIVGFFYRVTPYLLTITVVLMTFNCFVLYHTSKFEVNSKNAKAEYTLEELAIVRDYIVTRCNELSTEVSHDADGNVVFEGDMKETAILAMQNLGKDYPRLRGYYGTPKALYFSEFMCQQYMQGYYFPFSMEANYNDLMNIMNKPFTMCHELAHTHGYIYEDEANFFGFLACISSDNKVFEYSGYLGVLNYINNDFYEAVGKEEYYSHVKISDRVKYDNEFVSKETWKQIEENAVLSTETVKKAADTFIDTNLKVNGVSAGKVSYSHVVSLIMDYYSDLLLADAG